MDEKRLVEHFKWLHRHPELGFEERQTTAYLKEILEEHGVRLLDTGLETGALAAIGDGEPVVALRADIDALPILEESGLPYASEHPGVMHACGHDFHASMMLGAALLLKAREKELRGTVKVIFQPAEELAGGAKSVVATGLLDDVQAFYAGHTYPWLEPGTLGIRPGPIMASADRFTLKVTGLGCHAAHPELGVDPIPALTAIINSAQTIVSRSVCAFDSAVVSFTHIEAGNVWNVLPETVFAEGTVRAMTQTIREDVEKRLTRLVKAVAEAHGCRADFEYIYGAAPVSNDAGACDRARALALEMGFDAVEQPCSMGSEDFSAYLDIAPGGFFRIGTGGGVYDTHHPKFIADPAALWPAARFFAALAERELIRLSGN